MNGRDEANRAVQGIVDERCMRYIAHEQATCHIVTTYEVDSVEQSSYTARSLRREENDR